MPKPSSAHLKSWWPALPAAIAAGAGLLAALTPASATWLTAADVSPGTITTVAGGVGGPGLARGLALYKPCAVTYARGSTYVADLSAAGEAVIRRVASFGEVVNVAGIQGVGATAEGGSASGGQRGESCGVALDHQGNVLFSERADQEFGSGPESSQRIRVMPAASGTFYGRAMLAGHVYTIAGDGIAGDSGDGGPAVDAEVSQPSGLAVDAAGNVLFAETGNHVVRVIAQATGTFYGIPMTSGDIYTVAGNGQEGYSGDRGPALEARLDLGTVIRVDQSGNLLIADDGNRVVRVVPSVSGTYYGQPMTAGDIYTIIGMPKPPNGAPCGNSGSGGLWLSVRLCDTGIAVDRKSNLVITGDGATWIAAVQTGRFYGQPMRAGHIYEVIKPGATEVTTAVAVDPSGNSILAAPGFPGSAGGALYLLAERDSADGGLRHAVAGHVYRIGGDGSPSYSGEGVRAGRAQLGGIARTGGFNADGIAGLTVDGAGNLVVADKANLRVRVIAKRNGTFYGRHMSAGLIYTIAGNGKLGTSHRFTGLAAGTEVQPNGVATDPAGDLAVSGPIGGQGDLWIDAGKTRRLFGRRLIAGHVSVLLRCQRPKTTCVEPLAPVFDSRGNLLVNWRYSDDMAPHSELLVIAARTGRFYGRQMRAGHPYVLFTESGAGPVALDHAGDILFGSRSRQEVFVWPLTTGIHYGRFMHAHVVNEIVEDNTTTDSRPWSIAVDGTGHVLYTEPAFNQVKALAVADGSFYGVPMHAGQLFTIAGTGALGASGIGGPALHATLAHPEALTTTAAGDVLVGDLLRIDSIAG